MRTSLPRPSAKSNRVRGLAVAAALSLFLAVSAAVANDITVIFSGETHAMLNPCDCPDDPGGGLAERAAFLSGAVADKGRLLLLDGGGFSGGGIYDTYSAGRAADSTRTAKTIAAMGLMGYDAVGIGDDDLQYGGRWLVDRAIMADVPLVCANCFTADGKYLARPYVVVKKGGVSFAITSVATSERLFPIDTTVVIKDPYLSLEALRREMRRNSDYQILLSHLGEEETNLLLRRSPWFLLAANGHRKISVQPVTNMSRTPTLNFGFQGKSLSYAVMSWQNRALRVSRSGWFRIDESRGRDERIAALVYEPKPESGEDPAPPKIEEENKVYDLYIMSRCPYGIRALGEIADLIRAFPQREWNVWFIGTAVGDTLRSLGGEAEMFDEKLWLGVKALYPFRYHEFLFMRSSSPLSTEALLEDMGFDLEKIQYWVDDMGSSELRKHYLRSMGLEINASPTLYVNNNRFEKPLVGGRLVREECKAVEVEPPFCGDYPECFDDLDCWQPAKIGRCVSEEEADGGRAVCEFRDDAIFALTVLIADSAMSAPEKQPIETIRELMPGARINVVRLSADEGRVAMVKFDPAALPYFHFDANVANAHRFPAISEMVTEVGGGDGFTLKRGVISENYYPRREERRGMIELYADPLMPDIGKIINILLANPDLATRVVLRPMLFDDPSGDDLSAQDRRRVEEALRWLVLAEEFPAKYLQYLKIYGDDPSSTFRFDWLKRLGINRKRFMRRLEANQPKIAAHWESFSPVFSGEPVMILIGNRAKIAVTNERELERALKSIYY